MPTLFLHIGTAKTGTSSIQQFLLRNRDALRQQFNLMTPETGREHNEGSHHPLAFAFTDNAEQKAFYGSKTPAAYATELQAELHGCDADIILSSECFGFSRGGLVQFIQQVLPGYRVILVMYVRRIDQYVEAAWSQHVKGRVYVDSFDTFVENFEYFNYSWLRFWQSALGLDASSVIVAPYEPCQFYNNSLLDDFVYRLTGQEIPPAFDRPSEFSNPRLSRDALEYMLAVNRSSVARHKKDLFRERLQIYSSQEETASGGNSLSQRLLSAEQRRNLLASVEADDKRIARDYLGRDDGRLFLEPAPVDDIDQAPYTGLSARTVRHISERITGTPLASIDEATGLTDSEHIQRIVERAAQAL